MRFIHLSDLHIVPPGERLHGLDPAARLAGCVADIQRFCDGPVAPSFCVLTGDLVDRGDAVSYRYLQQLLDPLPIPYYLMVGNHDARQPFFEVFDQFGPDANGFVQYSLQTETADFLFLDTLDPGKPSGFMCERRLRWVSEQLEARAGRPVVLFTHHPVVGIGMPSLDRMNLTNADALRTVIGEHDVRQVFFGHSHRAISGRWQGIGVFGVPSSVHQFGSDFAEPERIPHIDGPPAYAFVDLTEDCTLMQLQHFLPEHQKPVQRDPMPGQDNS